MRIFSFSNQKQTTKDKMSQITKINGCFESECFDATGDWKTYCPEADGTECVFMKMYNFWPVDFTIKHTHKVFDKMDFKHENMRDSFAELMYDIEEKTKFYVNEKTGAVVINYGEGEGRTEDNFKLCLHIRYEDGKFVTTL